MTDCECEQSPNGYFSWSCVTGNCKQCQNNQYPLLSGEKTNPLVTFFQFELTNTPYQQKDKQGNLTEKVSKKTERVYHSLLFNFIGHKFLAALELLARFTIWIFQRTFPNYLNMNNSHLISTRNNTF